MAARGVTAADFGKTKSSAKFFRTREQSGDDDEGERLSAGPTRASADFLAQLRADHRAEVEARAMTTASASKPMPLPRAGPACAPEQPKHPPKSAPAPPKTFLSKAERRALKKRKRQDSGPGGGPG